jgi:hypothetical protein
MQKMEQRTTHADGGAIRIYANGLAVQFHGGSGDGTYAVYLHPDPADAGSRDIGFGRFVDSFEVAPEAAVHLAAHDCESAMPVYDFPEGRWFVYHDQDEHRVAIARMRD